MLCTLRIDKIFNDISNTDESNDIQEPQETISDNNSEPDFNSSDKTLTMGEFLSTSREIKQKYNSYVRTGFEKKVRMERVQKNDLPFKRTYDEWMQLFREYAET